MNLKFWKTKPEKRELEYVNVNTMAIGLNQPCISISGRAITLSSVFAAVEMISNSIAELPVYVKQHKDNKSDIIENHPIYLALNKNVMTRFMLMKAIVADMLLYGNGYAYIKRAGDGTPLELIYCKPGTVSVVWNKRREEPYYLCPELTSKKIEPVNMIHLYKNTEDGFTGKGVLAYATNTIKTSNFTEKSASNFFASGCNIGGILSTEQPVLNDKQRENIRTSWLNSHGSNNPNGIAVLEAGMKYQPVAVSSREAQMLETRLYNLQEVARFFNINPTLLGDLSKSSYNTLEAANTEFVLHTLMPIITLIQEEFQRKLLKPSEKTLYIDLDENYLIRPDKSSQANYLSTLVSSGIISINEARKQLGMNAIEGGDENIIPYTNLEQNTVSNINKNTTEEEDGQE